MHRGGVYCCEKKGLVTNVESYEYGLASSVSHAMVECHVVSLCTTTAPVPVLITDRSIAAGLSPGLGLPPSGLFFKRTPIL